MRCLAYSDFKTCYKATMIKSEVLECEKIDRSIKQTRNSKTGKKYTRDVVYDTSGF